MVSRSSVTWVVLCLVVGLACTALQVKAPLGRGRMLALGSLAAVARVAGGALTSGDGLTLALAVDGLLVGAGIIGGIWIAGRTLRSVPSRP